MATSLARLIAYAFQVARAGGYEVSLTHYAATGRDAYGKPTWSTTGTTIRGVMDDRERNQMTATGDLRRVTSSCVLPGTPLIAKDDRLTLPDGSQPLILDIRRVREASGVVAQEVFFG